jgi:hypothetical protein
MAKAVISCEKDGLRIKATASTPLRSEPMVTFKAAWSANYYQATHAERKSRATIRFSYSKAGTASPKGFKQSIESPSVIPRPPRVTQLQRSRGHRQNHR